VHIAGNAAQRRQLGKVNHFVYHRHGVAVVAAQKIQPVESPQNPGRFSPSSHTG